MVETGRDAGCPAEQVTNFLTAGYAPLPRHWAFHAAARECDRDLGPTEIAMGGTRGSAKSHSVLAQISLDDCQRYPGLKVLWLRRVMKSAAEGLEDLIGKILIATDYEYSSGRIKFTNTSRILVGGYKDEADIDKYLGLEYDLIALEEATQISQGRYDRIRGSLRSTKPNYRPRMYLTTNPDGIGMAWFKELFYMPWKMNQQTRRRFFFAHWKDNPFLPDNYIEYLKELTGPLGKAWREGDFDAFEGMAFPTWNPEIHIIQPREIPYTWTRRRSIDWGYDAPFGCLWIARDPDTGRRIYYREAYERQLSDMQQAKLIKEMTPKEEVIRVSWADPSLFNSKNSIKDRVTSTADAYAAEGVFLTRADNDRLSGKRKIDRMLGLLPDGEPGLQIFSTCYNFLKTFPMLPRDKLKPEDVDTKAEDHLYDCARYDATDLELPKEPPKIKPATESRLAGIKNL